MTTVNIFKTLFFACFILSNYSVEGKSTGELAENNQSFESKSQAVEKSVKGGFVANAGNTPVDLDILVNTSLSISCSLFSSTVVYKNRTYNVSSENLSWKFGTKFLYHIKTLGDLTIQYEVENARENDSGVYSCYVTIPELNKDFIVYSTAVSVGYPPQQVQNFSCISYEYTNLTCSWIKPFNPVKTEYKLYDYMFHESLKRECPEKLNDTSCRWTLNTQPQYRIQPVKLYFLILGNNSLGKSKQYAVEDHFKIVKPGIPTSVMIMNVTETSVTVIWSPPKYMSYQFAPGLEYSVLYQAISPILGPVQDIRNVSHGEGLVNIRNLIPYTEYLFKIRCRSTKVDNDDFWSPSVTAIERTKPVPLAPKNLEATFVSNTSIGLKWEEAPASTGLILRYKIWWRNSNNESGTENTPSNETHHTLKRLLPFVLYVFRVSAVESRGPGESSDELKIRTEVGVSHAPTALTPTEIGNTSVQIQWREPAISTGPNLRYRVQWKNSSAVGEEDVRDTRHTGINLAPHAPINVAVWKVTNTSVEVNWNEPSVSTGPVLGYRIRWKNSSVEGEEDTRSAATSHTVKDLTPYVNYTLRVLALTSAGPGEWSSQVTFQTAVGTPHAPRNVAVGKVTNTSVEVNWNEPSVSTGPVLGYRIHWKNSSQEGEEDTRSAATFHTLKDLTPYVNYSLRVLALTSAGPGEGSSEVTFRTAVGNVGDATNCSLYMRNCEETGGYCTRERNGRIQCKCPEKSTYELKYGCRKICYDGLCENEGTCIVERGTFKCVCKEPFVGKFCETDLCRGNFCRNGGICRVDKGVAKCYCKEPYGGTYCGFRMDTCVTNICGNGGLCRIMYGEPECFCMVPYSGKFCETRIDPPKMTVPFAVICSLAVFITLILTSVICLCCHRLPKAKK